MFFFRVLTRQTRNSDDYNNENEDLLRIEGLRIESSDKGVEMENGVPDIISNSNAVLRLFGSGLTVNTVITFTHEIHKYQGSCQLPSTERFKVN